MTKDESNAAYEKRRARREMSFLSAAAPVFVPRGSLQMEPSLSSRQVTAVIDGDVTTVPSMSDWSDVTNAASNNGPSISIGSSSTPSQSIDSRPSSPGLPNVVQGPSSQAARGSGQSGRPVS